MSQTWVHCTGDGIGTGTSAGTGNAPYRTLTFNEVVALGHAGEEFVEVLVALVARDGEPGHRDVVRVQVELVALVRALAVGALGVERACVRVHTPCTAIGWRACPRAARARSDRSVV